jgi:hypothetical protein
MVAGLPEVADLAEIVENTGGATKSKVVEV